MSQRTTDSPHFPPVVIAQWVRGTFVPTEKLVRELREWMYWFDYRYPCCSEPGPDEVQTGTTNEVRPDVRCQFIWPFRRHRWLLWSGVYQVRIQIWDDGEVMGYDTEFRQKKICEDCGKTKVRKVRQS